MKKDRADKKNVGRDRVVRKSKDPDGKAPANGLFHPAAGGKGQALC